jgi:signal transduction histidine kinase
MHKFNRKLLLMMSAVLIVMLLANSLMLFNAFGRFHRNALRRENTQIAQNIADMLVADPSLATIAIVKTLFEINQIKGVVITPERGIIYDNLDGLTVPEILKRRDLVAARAQMTSADGSDLGQVIIVEREGDTARIRTIFLIAIATSGFFGILMILALSTLLYRMVNRPLRQITEAMATDRYLEPLQSDWDSLVQAHNHAKKARDRFFQEASHAMKSPLMNIQGSVEAYEDGLFTESEMRRKILDEVARLKESVDQMLRSGKADSTVIDPAAWQPIDMEAFVRDISPILPSHLKLIQNVDAKPFDFDRQILQIILENLIQNAIRYARQKITITYRHTPQSIVMRIQDDGDGVEPAVVPVLFERFAKGKEGKSGLGLAIVKTYVTLTGGTIAYLYEEGACFEIVWPIK